MYNGGTWIFCSQHHGTIQSSLVTCFIPNDDIVWAYITELWRSIDMRYDIHYSCVEQRWYSCKLCACNNDGFSMFLIIFVKWAMHRVRSHVLHLVVHALFIIPSDRQTALCHYILGKLNLEEICTARLLYLWESKSVSRASGFFMNWNYAGLPA